MLIGEEFNQEFMYVGSFYPFFLISLIHYLQVFLHYLLIMDSLVPYKLGNTVFIKQKIVLFWVVMLSLLYNSCIIGVPQVTRLNVIKVFYYMLKEGLT